jgi:hypothetical protein
MARNERQTKTINPKPTANAAPALSARLPADVSEGRWPIITATPTKNAATPISPIAR